MPAREVATRVDTAEMVDWIGYSRYKAALERAALAKAEAQRDMKRTRRETPAVLVAGKRDTQRGID